MSIEMTAWALGVPGIPAADVPHLFDRFFQEALREYPELKGRRLLYESIRRMLSAQVYDVIAATRETLCAMQGVSVDAVRRSPVVVTFSAAMRRQSIELKQFLFRNLYRHPQVMATTGAAQTVVRELFALYSLSPDQMQAGFRDRADQPRSIADYIAGMTDRFAAREHERLTGQRLLAP